MITTYVGLFSCFCISSNLYSNDRLAFKFAALCLETKSLSTLQCWTGVSAYCNNEVTAISEEPSRAFITTKENQTFTSFLSPLNQLTKTPVKNLTNFSNYFLTNENKRTIFFDWRAVPNKTLKKFEFTLALPKLITTTTDSIGPNYNGLKEIKLHKVSHVKQTISAEALPICKKITKIRLVVQPKSWAHLFQPPEVELDNTNADFFFKKPGQIENSLKHSFLTYRLQQSMCQTYKNYAFTYRKAGSSANTFIFCTPYSGKTVFLCPETSPNNKPIWAKHSTRKHLFFF